MALQNIDEIMEACQSLVDEGVLTLEEGQDLFDDNLNDYLIELKKEVDSSYDEGLITAYEKDICYINMGIDLEGTYESTISNLINSELSYMEEKPKAISKEEYYRQLAEKQAKKEKRNKLFKKVGKVAAGAAIIGAGAYALDKLDDKVTANSLVRADNPDYSDIYDKYNRTMKLVTDDYNKELSKAGSEVEKADCRDKFNARKAKIEAQFRANLADRKNALATNDMYKTKEQARKERDEKSNKYSRSDYFRQEEINKLNNRRFMTKKRREKEIEKINNKYDNYNKTNIK